jgi:L-amino acid N-acyltransferase YncA
MSSAYPIKLANINNLQAIILIYNSAIKAKFETADTTPVKWENKIKWFKEHTPNKYPIFVYEIDNQVVAWASISPYRKGRKALDKTAEISYYVHPLHKNKGIGTQLLSYIINTSKQLKYKTLIAIVIEKNLKSIQLLNKFNFTLWGTMPNIVEFDADICSHLYYGLQIN